MGRHLPYGITQCYLPPDISERAPRLDRNQYASAPFTYPRGMEGWADLGYPAMHQPGVELETSRSQVRRPNHYTTEPPKRCCVHVQLKQHGVSLCTERSYSALFVSSWNRPVSESESERQRARNGASESERDFSRERATIHTSESKRAKFKTGHDFFVLQCSAMSSDVCGIYRTYGNPVSVRFPLFQHQHSTNGLFLG